MSLQSKGGILSKACDYIRELRQSNQRLQESLKEVERIQVDNELCRQQVGPQVFLSVWPRLTIGSECLGEDYRPTQTFYSLGRRTCPSC